MKKEGSKPLRLLRLAYEVDPKWMTALVAYACQCRETQPIPNYAGLSIMEQAQYAIVSDWLKQWREQNSDAFTPRSLSGMFAGYTPRKRLAVFTSNMPGLAAAMEIYNPRPPTMIPLLGTEYGAWMERTPESNYGSHWHLFCHFRPPFLPHFSNYTVVNDPKLTYWEQDCGAMYGPLCGNGESILWRWDGQAAVKVSSAGWLS